jgi:hypothetical protein
MSKDVTTKTDTIVIGLMADRAVWWLKRLAADSNLGEDDLCAKIADTANRLLAQSCIIGLKREYGWSNAELARRVGVSSDRPGRWLRGDYTASPKNLAALWRLYRATASYKRASNIATAYPMEGG